MAFLFRFAVFSSDISFTLVSTKFFAVMLIFYLFKLVGSVSKQFRFWIKFNGPRQLCLNCYDYSHYLDTFVHHCRHIEDNAWCLQYAIMAYLVRYEYTYAYISFQNVKCYISKYTFTRFCALLFTQLTGYLNFQLWHLTAICFNLFYRSSIFSIMLYSLFA